MTLKSLLSLEGEHNGAVGLIYSSMADFCAAQGLLEEALRYKQRSLDITKCLPREAESHPDVAARFDGIGTKHTEIGNTAKVIVSQKSSMHLR